MAISATATRSTEVGARLFTLNQEHAPGRSVALITVAMSEAFPPGGGRVLEAVPMEVVFMAAVDDIGDLAYQR